MNKELTRSMGNKMIAGVVSGIQRAYLPQMDLTLLRVLVAVGTFLLPPLTAVVIPAYLIMWVIVPADTKLQLQA